MRKLLIGVSVPVSIAVLASLSLASATAAEPPPPSVANIVTCSGAGLVSQAVQAGACSTDAAAGVVKWNGDYSAVRLQAKAKPDSPPVAAAGGWSSNGPLDVTGSDFCVTLRADPHLGPSGYGVVDVALSWDGVQQPTVTFPVSRGAAAYCVADVPSTAENFFWQATGVTGASQGDQRVKLQFVGVSFATGP